MDEALGLAAEHGEDAKYLAGGQSLLPLMKLRFAAPTVLIDLGRVTELSYVRDEGTYVAIGALTRHHDVATSALLLSDIPLLAHTAEAVGDPQIRHRGTIGGSVAHADAAADLPATLLALDATFVVRGASRRRARCRPRSSSRASSRPRSSPASCSPRSRCPSRPPRPRGRSRSSTSGRSTSRSSAWPSRARRSRWSTWARRRCGPTAVESALASGASVADAAALAAEGTNAGSDIHASKAYREHLARVLVRRALEEASSRA